MLRIDLLTITLVTFGTSSICLYSYAQEESKKPTSSKSASQSVSKKLENLEDTRLELDGMIGGWNTQDRQLDVKAIGLELGARLEHELSPQLGTVADLHLEVAEGESTSPFTDEYDPRNRFSVYEATLWTRPARWLEVKGGVLDQGAWNHPLLLSETGFPGLTEKVFLRNSTTQLSIAAQQAIPTSRSKELNIDSSSSSGQNSLALFFYEQIELEHRPIRPLSLKGGLGHYLFNDLNRGAAQESRALGNSILGFGDQNADFRYQYHGWIGFTEVLGQLTPSYALGVRGSFLNNWQAPVGQNQGWALSLFSQIRLPKTKFEPRIGLFRDEADSSPAVYGSKNFGFKNRAGWFIGADVSWDSGFYARSEYTQASTLLSSPFQSEFEYFQLGIGTKYDLL